MVGSHILSRWWAEVGGGRREGREGTWAVPEELLSESNSPGMSSSADVHPQVGPEFVKDSWRWYEHKIISFLPIISPTVLLFQITFLVSPSLLGKFL